MTGSSQVKINEEFQGQMERSKILEPSSAKLTASELNWGETGRLLQLHMSFLKEKGQRPTTSCHRSYYNSSDKTVLEKVFYQTNSLKRDFIMRKMKSITQWGTRQHDGWRIGGFGASIIMLGAK